jgi:hypothetical protein
MEVKLTCPLGYAANNIFMSFLQMPRVQINNTSNQTDRRTQSATQRNVALCSFRIGWNAIPTFRQQGDEHRNEMLKEHPVLRNWLW